MLKSDNLEKMSMIRALFLTLVLGLTLASASAQEYGKTVRLIGNPSADNVRILNSKAKTLPSPAYPAEAKKKKIGGRVFVQIRIDDNGTVLSATAIDLPLISYSADGTSKPVRLDPVDARLVEAAEKAALKATFEAKKMNVNEGILFYNFDPVPGKIKSSATLGTSEVKTIEAGDACAQSKCVSGGMLNGKALALPRPAYPAIAKAAGVKGSVSVQVLIDETGMVVSAIAVSGNPMLTVVAVDAARQAMFAPVLLDGRPVKVAGIIVYNFQ